MFESRCVSGVTINPKWLILGGSFFSSKFDQRGPTREKGPI